MAARRGGKAGKMVSIGKLTTAKPKRKPKKKKKKKKPNPGRKGAKRVLKGLRGTGL